MPSTRQQAVQLLNLFERLWKEKYGKKYRGNRHADQWGFRDMIDDVGMEEAEEVVQYYFHLSSPDHSRQWLIYNYNKVAEQRIDVEKDKQARRELLRRTKEKMEELNSGESGS